MKDFKFDKLEYVRPDLAKFKETLSDLTNQLSNASSYEEAKKVFLLEDEKMQELESTFTIAFVRNTLDTTDEFYEAEVAYFNDEMPTVQASLVSFGETLSVSPFRNEFEKEYGKQIFTKIELEKNSFCEVNIPLMQQEAKLTNEYQKIMATAKIPFDGKELNLYGVQKYFEHDDRNVRKAAVKAYSDFYHSNETRLEEIWDELIKIRNEMGKNLGFDNYIPLGYILQGRTDYGYKEVASFREQVRTELVPLCSKLYEAQAKRLDIDKVHFYDEKTIFADGNATPAGDDDFMIEQARKMYHEMSPETGEFIDFMIEHNLMDLKNKPGKASTGYMTTLPSFNAPFVFSCFNQTIFDAQVLTHELGHAFAGYEAMRNQPISDYYSMSTDIAEIHSMSMEQFSYPYAEYFFDDDADKFRFAHLQDAITFVPFGVAVDEFQHICYEKENLTPKERTLEWKKLEEKYMPWRDYEDDEFFNRGGYWYHKLHIFLYPFYYINYTLTTMGAMEFKKKDHENHEQAWNDYLKLCKCGGSLSYLETLKYANVSNPFEDGSVAKSTTFAREELLNSPLI